MGVRHGKREHPGKGKNMTCRGNGKAQGRDGKSESTVMEHPYPETSEYDVFEPDFAANSKLLEEVDRREYEILLGQCKGTLVSDGTRVVVCCCRDLAEAVCFRGAHIHDGRLYLARGTRGPFSDGDGGVYLIREAPPAPLSNCPFCDAVLIPHSRLAHYS